MAATQLGKALSEAHRVGQVRIAAQTVHLLTAAFPLLDPKDIDGTFERWLRVAVPAVQAQRQASSQLAGHYVTAFRAAELRGHRVTSTPLVLADPAPIDAVTTSLLVTGPYALRKSLSEGVDFGRALDVAEARSAAAGMRHALNGGRDTIVQTVNNDKHSFGWARSTGGNACVFCAMLASRGPVYGSELSGSFEAHDHCTCTAEPVYQQDAAWPPGSERYREIWDESTDGLSGDDARSAFADALASA
jgi:hypothetical protein